MSINALSFNADGNQFYSTVYSPVTAVTNAVVFIETAQPVFTNAGYYFAQPWSYNRNPIPDSQGFTVTNVTPLLIQGVGVQQQIAGYAKLGLQNGYSGIYGYLGQYFDHAYKVDANGNVTATNTGILSPYGDFLATEPGRVALVTMPDIDPPYQRGTCIVYAVSLQLDANHDGNMDVSVNGTDTTTYYTPYTFWRNNDLDRFHAVDIGDFEQDDLLAGEDGFANFDPDDPDYDYKDQYGNRVIPCARDSEDFARLWVCGMNSQLYSNLPPTCTITLSWDDVGFPNQQNPTIDLFQAPSPGLDYLTNVTTSASNPGPIRYSYIGRLAPGTSIELDPYNLNFISRGPCFLFCGVTNGIGRITLTIADGTKNLAKTYAFIQITDIKDMYERWTVGDKPGQAPTNTAHLAANDLPDPTVPPFQYAANTDTNTPYILYVHGWNMSSYSKDRFAETAFKRLYWQGYQGRFGIFRWPTLYAFPLGEASLQAINLDNFDTTEFASWRSGVPLRNFLVTLNNEYPGQVRMFAHSHGNIAASEALRTNVNLVHTYVAMQAAVPSHAYDTSTTTRSLGVWDSLTPERTARYWTNGASCYFNGITGAANFINFYNAGDWALSWWLTDQNTKPDVGYEWQYQGNNLPETYTYNNFPVQSYQLYFPTNTYEIFSYITEGRCYAVGQQEGIGQGFDPLREVDLSQSPYSFGTQHKGHSAEFRSDNAQRWQFWDQALKEMDLKQ